MAGDPPSKWPKGRLVKVLGVVAVAIVVVVAFFALGGLALVCSLGQGSSGFGCTDVVVSAPSAPYDEQLYLVQGGDSGSIAYDVTVVAQSDSSGYGPAYLVNGLTSIGYWYQVGISYNWEVSGGHLTGFYFVSEVWNPSGKAVLGPNLAPISVHSGDQVNLSLEFSGSSVVMSAHDMADGAGQSQSYSAEGSSGFEGGTSAFPSNPGSFTGVMTEWYHVHPYYGGESAVSYTAITPLAGSSSDSVTLGIDEKEASGTGIFSQTDPVVFTGSSSTPYTYENANETVSPTVFQTGGS